MSRTIKRLMNLFGLGHPRLREIDFDGHTLNRTDSGEIEHLKDDDLRTLNDMIPWKCFTADMKGRRLGNAAWAGKRDTPQDVDDERIARLDSMFDLSTKSVLEVGCFEGIHTIALARRAARTFAVDSRIENVVKTLIRANMFGYQPIVRLVDLESPEDCARLPHVDVVHHVGVLYHLADPVRHLLQLGEIAGSVVLLDTQYASEEMTNDAMTVAGREYRYHRFPESGRADVFSGMYDHAKWLLLDDILRILKDSGYSDIVIHKNEVQRNGPRVTLFASRPGVRRATTQDPA